MRSSFERRKRIVTMSHPAFTTAYAYNYTYYPSTVRRTMRCRHFPSMALKQSPGFITQNLHVPKGPHRRLFVDRPTGLGLGTTTCTMYLSTDKPIVRSPRPQEFNRELLARTRRSPERLPVSLKEQERTSYYCNKEVNKISVQRRWTSTTREATEESALPTPKWPVPISTLEPDADPVRHRAQKCYPEPRIWQQYAREWDMMQLRRPMPALGEQKARISLPEIPENSCIVHQGPNLPLEERKRTNMNANTAEEPVDWQHTEEFFTRPMPGYGGFVPRHAVEPKCLTASMCSTSRRTYRRFPPEEYSELQFAHKGPLSKTVTLTYPFNPFKKV